MNERETRGDIRNAEIKWKVPGAGMVLDGAFVALVDRIRTRLPAPATTDRQRAWRPTYKPAARRGRPRGRW